MGEDKEVGCTNSVGRGSREEGVGEEGRRRGADEGSCKHLGRGERMLLKRIEMSTLVVRWNGWKGGKLSGLTLVVLLVMVLCEGETKRVVKERG